MDSDVFVKAVETEDELGCVLRMHLILERLLDEFSMCAIPRSHKKYHPVRLTFSGKLSLATSYGLLEEIAEPIYLINKIRNKFAHDANYQLTPDRIDVLTTAVEKIKLSGQEWKPMSAAYMEIHSRPGEKLKFGEHGVKLDFILLSGRLVGKFSQWFVFLSGKYTLDSDQASSA